MNRISLLSAMLALVALVALAALAALSGCISPNDANVSAASTGQASFGITHEARGQVESAVLPLPAARQA